MNKARWLAALTILICASLACSVFTGGNKKAPTPQVEINQNISTQAVQAGNQAGTQIAEASTQAAELIKTAEASSAGLPATTEAATVEPPSQSGGSTNEVKTEFPLPPNVSNLMDLGNNAINFQTKMNMKDAIAFYREAFAKEGYKERQINTAISDATFSLVFDGHPSGKAIVIQGVDMMNGSVNINLRFEDI